MTRVPENDGYVLGRSIFDSIRLDAQHLLWKLQNGYEIHPRIPIRSNMKIAELGTGTAIWLLDVARSLPQTVQLYGFDISDAQYPPKDLWPENVKLGLLDSLVDPPPSLVGQFDVVHLRMWASNLQGDDTQPILQHVKRLLKPGGYVQWEDADLVNQVVKGVKAEDLQERMKGIFDRAGLDYSWVSDLPTRMKQHGFDILESESSKFRPSLIQLCTNTYLMALREILQGIKRKLTGESLLSIVEHERALYHISLQNTDGFVYNWSPVTVLVRNVA